ncbi:MAG: choice-of-anchor J domain-containing protein [Thermoplasmatales archaeon]|nr:choice-of-anchor J domain-containing protein [Thermoplasmatales archaeon]
MELIVELKEGEINELYRGIEADRELVTKIVNNPKEILTYPKYATHTCEYVIITNEELKNAPGPYNFTTLMNSKIAKGMNATIVTVEYIYSNFAGRDNPEKIRNFIKWAYQEWHTQYVLLGGDVSVVPHRALYVEVRPGDPTSSRADIESDLYYACLDGDYNSDGDSYWGEPNDGPGGRDVDLVAEVYVGRAPVENAEELSNFVRKTLEYDASQDPYLNNVLLCGEYLGFGGIARYASSYKEEIRNGSNANGYYTVGIPGDEYNISTLYDAYGYSWGVADLAVNINRGVHIINHLGHGQVDRVMRFTDRDLHLLRNTNYFFVYSQACLAGHFTIDDCIAEKLVNHPNGPFAVIMNANYGWGRHHSTDGPSQAYDRAFFHVIFGENIRELGKANQLSKEYNLYRLQEDCMRWCYYEINLLGDPEIAVKPGTIRDNDVRVKSINEPKPGQIIAPGTYRVNATIENTGLNDQSNFSVELSIYKLTKVIHFFDDMESGSTNWTAVDGNGDGDTWTISTARYNSQNHSFKCTSQLQYGRNANDSLISKPINLLGRDHAILEAWIWADGEWRSTAYDPSGYMDYGTIYLSDDNGLTWNEVKTNISYCIGRGGWVRIPIEKYIDLTHQVRIKFTWVSDANNEYEGMYVDDVIVYSWNAELVHYDEKTISLESGKQTYVEFDPWNASNGFYAINVTTKLEGDEYQDNDWQNLTFEVRKVIDVGVSSVNSPTGVKPTGSYSVNATVANYGNTYQTNLSVHLSVYNFSFKEQPLLNENFDSGSAPGWAVEDTNRDLVTWSLSTGGRSPPYCVNYPGSGAVIDANDWLFTPGLNLKAGYVYNLSFWWVTAYPMGLESMDIWFGSAQNSSSMTTRIWNGYRMAVPSYRQTNVWFTVPSDGIYYIGFHCYSVKETAWSLSVDDVMLKESSELTLIFEDEKQVNLNSREYKYVEFSPFNFEQEGYYAINVSTNLAEDEDARNNYKNTSFNVQNIYDVGVVSINYPPDAISPGYHTLNATIKNFGNVPIDNVPINCTVYKFDIFLNESFEHIQFPPPGWTRGVISGTTQWWWSGSSYADGGYSAVSNSTLGDRYLQSPPISLPPGTLTTLEFYLRRSGTPNASEVLNVEVQPSGGNWETVLTINSTVLGAMSTAWYIITVDLSSYEGQGISIRFRNYKPGTGAFIYIDGVTVKSKSLALAGDTNIGPIAPGEIKYVEFGPVPINVESLYLVRLETRFSLDEDAGNNYKEKFVEVRNIYDGGVKEINYPPAGIIISSGPHIINATVKNYGTVSTYIPVNCSLYKIDSTILNEGFVNTTFPPPGWLTGRISGSVNWGRVAIPYFSTPGSAQGYQAAGERYLTTPQITLTSGKGYILEFGLYNYNQKRKIGEFLNISISTTSQNGPWENLLVLGASELNKLGTNVWYLVTLDLSKYAGNNTWIRFNWLSGNTGNILIDDVSVYSADLVFGEDKSVYLNAGEENYVEFGPHNFAEGIHYIRIKTRLEGDTNIVNDVYERAIKVKDIHDVGAISINYPTGSILLPESLKVNATIKNFGNIPQSNIPVNCTIYKIITPSIVLFADFSNGLPTGWTIVNGGSPGNYPGTDIPATWTHLNPGLKQPEGGCLPPFMIVDSDYFGPPNPALPESDKEMFEQLITPEMTFTGAQKVLLEFDHSYKHIPLGHGKVKILEKPVEPGDPWNEVTLVTYTSDTEGHMAYDITPYAAGKTIKIMWEYWDFGLWGWYWMIDNVKVSVNYTLEEVFSAEEDSPITLPPGSEEFVEFEWIIKSGAGVYLINVTTMLSQDENQTNNYTTKIIALQGVSDVGVKAINSPLTGIYNLNTSFRVNATIANEGIANLSDIKVNCTIKNSTGGIVFTEEQIIPGLSPGEEIYVEFGEWIGEIEDTYRINVTAFVEDDANPHNDYQEITIELKDFYDIAVVSINYPTGTQFTGTYEVNATVSNYGNMPAGEFIVNCTIRNLSDNIVFTDEKVFSGLAVGEQIYVIFDPWTVTIEDTYAINITAELINQSDEYPNNDYREINLIINDIDDVGATAINYPSYVEPVGSYAVNATVTNFGNIGKTNVPVNCSIYRVVSKIFSEGFEGTVPPDGWIFGIESGTKYWVQVSAYKHSGNYSVYSTQAYEGERYMITPGINIPSGALLEFWLMRYPSAKKGDFFNVSVSTSQSGPWTLLLSMDYNMINSLIYQQWYEFVLDLSQYAGQTIYIKFNHKVNLAGAHIFIDDVAVYNSTFLQGEEKIIDYLNAYTSTYVEFSPYNFEQEGKYVLSVKTLMEGDENSGNNEKTMILDIDNIYDAGAISINYPYEIVCTGYHAVNATIKNFGNFDLTNIPVNLLIGKKDIKLNESFETSWPPAGWKLGYWGSQVTQWVRNSTYAHSGMYSASTIPTYPAGSYMASPVISIPSGTIVLEFWLLRKGTFSSGEYFNVSVAPTQEAEEWTVLMQLNQTEANELADSAWYRFTIDLSSYAGQSISIRFNYYKTQWGERGVCLDDVILYSPTWLFEENKTIPGISAGETVYVTFSPFNFAEEGVYYIINVETRLPVDENNTNNATEALIQILNIRDVGVKSVDYPPRTIALLDEKFEGTFPPAGWRVVENGDPGGRWKRNDEWGRTNYAGGDGYCALADKYKFGAGKTMDTELWSPPINLTGYKSAFLEFVTAYNDASDTVVGPGKDYADVDISTNGGLTWTNLLHWDESHSPYGPGELVTIDLTPYLGQTVIIRWHYYGPAMQWNCYYWEIDNVKVTAELLYEPGNYPIKATVKNYGTTTETFDVRCKIYTTKTTTVFSDDVESGEDGWFHLDAYGNPQYDLWHISTRRYASPSHSWYCGNETLGRYLPSMFNWLVSPMINVGGAVQVILKWKQWYEIEDNKDYGILAVSADGYRFTLIRYYTGRSIGGGWEEEKIDITRYVNKTTGRIAIAFLFVSDDTGNYEGWYIDDVEIIKITKEDIVYQETLRVNDLEAGEERQITFPPFTALVERVYSIEVTTLLTGDINSTNDYKDSTISTKTGFPPVTTCSCFGPLGCNNWYIGPVTIYLDATDADGVAYTRYRINGGEWQNYTGPVTVSTEGLYTVEYYSVDTLGATESIKSCSFGIAYSMPVTTCIIDGTMGENGWYTSNVQIKLVANAYICGVKETYYRIDGGEWQNYVGPFTFTSEGTHTIEYYSVSNSCIVETPAKITVFKIDKTAPTVKVVYPNGGEVLGGIITIRWTASDNIGIASIDLLYSNDAGLTWNVIASNIPNTGSYNWNTTGLPYGSNYMVKIIAKDSAGNKASDTSDGTFTITAPTPPTVSIVKPRNALYIFDREIIPLPIPVIIGGITIEATATSTTGIAKVEFYIDNVLKFTDTSEPYSWTWDERAIGMHEIKAIAYDSSGQTTTDRISVFIINF